MSLYHYKSIRDNFSLSYYLMIMRVHALMDFKSVTIAG